jgi:tRNA 2-thiouridine synthesizing protein A
MVQGSDLLSALMPPATPVPEGAVPSPSDVEQITVDACGAPCPVPILELAKAARRRPAGTQLVLWATDPAVERDVLAWCEATGHRVLAQDRDGGRFRAVVELT